MLLRTGKLIVTYSSLMATTLTRAKTFANSTSVTGNPGTFNRAHNLVLVTNLRAERAETITSYAKMKVL